MRATFTAHAARTMAAAIAMGAAAYAGCGSSTRRGTTSTNATEPGGDATASGDASAATTSDASGGSIMGQSDAGTSAVNEDASTPTPPTYTDFDINHIIFTGQSNSVANGGDPPLTHTQPYGNLMFDTGPMSDVNCDNDGCDGYDPPHAFAPLVEGDTFMYPVETPSSSIANAATKLALERYGFGSAGRPAKHDVLVTLDGRSGYTYWCLRKGGCNYHSTRNVPYAQSMQEVTDAIALAKAAGKSYVVRALVAIHGESDHDSYTLGQEEFPMPRTDGHGTVANYEDALFEWQRDYESDVRAQTGQTLPIPLFITQLSGWNDTTYSQVAQWQLDAHVDSKGKVILATPAYFVSSRDDCRHLTNNAYRWLGEYIGKAYAQVILGGRAWEPLRPSAITRAGNVLTVKYLVPVPPLVIDTTTLSDPGNYGFTLVDDAGAAPSITDVALSGPDTLAITLSSAPSPTAHLRYAQNQVAGTCIGPLGARGNIHDSDKTPSLYGNDLSNWSVMFDLPVP